MMSILQLMRGRRGRRWAACLVAGFCASAVALGDAAMEPDPKRVGEIRRMLRAEPGTFGVPIEERDVWTRVAQQQAFENTIARAEAIMRRPIPPMPESLYREIVASGSRADHYRLYNQRAGTLDTLCAAECLENEGRFLPRIEELVAELCGEATWIVPLRKQQSIDNLEGTRNTIDLNKAMRAWELALADYLLADRLRPATRQRIRDNLERRIFTPYRDMIAGRQKADFWIAVTSNWNSVCLAGVTGAALTIVESREERAWFAAAAEKHSQAFLAGFQEDGYCTEGMSYWNFGFSNYLALAEALWQVTDGNLDLFARPKVESIALFGARIEIADGVYPAFADCVPSARPLEWLMHFMSRRFQLGLGDWEDGEMATVRGPLYVEMLSALPNSATRVPPAEARVSTLPVRHYFDDAGILICRPGTDSDARLAVALKGGHNGEHHNHNDVGSFVVVIHGTAPLLDVGAEVYTNRTFSARRYESNVLNSHGHPVPVVADTLQSVGKDARARVLQTTFTPEQDTFELDLSAAYDVPSMRRLERTFVYSREGEGELIIADRVEFDTPQAFGTALMTLGRWQQLGPQAWMVHDGAGALRVRIDASAPLKIIPETLDERLRVDAGATRLGICFASPQREGQIIMRITPALPPGHQPGRLLRNGGFEAGSVGWNIPSQGMATLSTERAAEGTTSLHIVDTSATAGSNVLSDRFPLVPNTDYELRGMVYGVSGAGVGVYVRLLGRRGELLQKTSEERVKSFITVGDQPAAAWVPFVRRFRTTPDTRFGRIWLHSFNASTADAFIDDLRLIRVEP